MRPLALALLLLVSQEDDPRKLAAELRSENPEARD